MITQNKKTHTLHLAGFSLPNKSIDAKKILREDQEAGIAMQSEGGNIQLADEERLTKIGFPMFSDITPIQSVGDLSHNKYPLSVRSDTFLPFVVFYMGLMRVEAAGIIDEKNNCIGFVTSEDLIDFSDGSKCNSKYPRITDVMRAPNMAVYLDDSIEQAVIMMNLHKIDWLPVINFDTQHFSGLVCRKDIEKFPRNIIAFPKRNFAFGDAV